MIIDSPSNVVLFDLFSYGLEDEKVFNSIPNNARQLMIWVHCSLYVGSIPFNDIWLLLNKEGKSFGNALLFLLTFDNFELNSLIAL